MAMAYVAASGAAPAGAAKSRARAAKIPSARRIRLGPIPATIVNRSIRVMRRLDGATLRRRPGPNNSCWILRANMERGRQEDYAARRSLAALSLHAALLRGRRAAGGRARRKANRKDLFDDLSSWALGRLGPGRRAGDRERPDLGAGLETDRAGAGRRAGPAARPGQARSAAFPRAMDEDLREGSDEPERGLLYDPRFRPRTQSAAHAGGGDLSDVGR